MGNNQRPPRPKGRRNPTRHLPFKNPRRTLTLNDHDKELRRKSPQGAKRFD